MRHASATITQCATRCKDHNKTQVCPKDLVPRIDDSIIVKPAVGGREIGVFNLGGTFYALRNICPHRGAPLCRGRLRPLVTSPEVYRNRSKNA